MLRSALELVGLSLTLSRVSFGIVAAFYYNILLTLNDEIAFIWTRKLNSGSIIYLLTRYLGAACLSYNLFQWLQDFYSSCLHAALDSASTICNVVPPKTSVFIGLPVMFLSLVLQQLRTSALYLNSKKVIAIFVLMDWLLVLGLFILLARQSNIYLATTSTPRIWAMFAMAEFVTVALCLYQSWRTYRRMPRQAHAKGSPIIHVVLRDNILYFLAVFIVYAVGIVMEQLLATANFGPAEDLHFMAAIAISGTAAPLMFIHLRKYFDPQAMRSQAILKSPIAVSSATIPDCREETSEVGQSFLDTHISSEL